MKNNSEAENTSFPHLWEILPGIKSITELDPNDVNSEHLWFLDDHLQWLQIKFPEIYKEIASTREKLQIAMSSPKSFVSWESMKAANNEKYSQVREYRSVGEKNLDLI